MKIRDGLVLRTVGSDHVIVAEGLDALDLRCMVQVNDAVALLWNKAKETNFLRRSAFDCLMRKLLFAERDIHSGDVTSRLTKDVETVCNVQVSLFPQMMVCTIQVIGAFLLMHSMDVVLAWVLLLITPFVVIAGKLISRTLRQMTERIRIKESRVQMLVQEGVEHNAMLRSLRGVKWMTGLL